MQLENVDANLRSHVFEFFYWFSRFEFALKERRFLKSKAIGARAEPDWTDFIKKFESQYELSQDGSSLIAQNPKCQIVGQHELEFVPVTYKDQPSELRQVVTLLKTVRNNLFHGGKHGDDGWDDPERIMALLGLSIRVLHELADLADFGADYTRYY